MSGPNAVHGEMPGFTFPGRPGGEREPLLDMVFDRRPLPPGAPQEIHALERMLTALAGPAESGELVGEASALAAFTRLASPAGVSHRAPRRHRRSRRPARARLALAAALTTVVAGVGGTVAAYADVLPAPIQQIAHEALGAPPPPQHHPASTGSPRPATVRPTPASQPGPSQADRASGQNARDRAASPKRTHPRTQHGRPFASPACTPSPPSFQTQPAQGPSNPSPTSRPSVTPCRASGSPTVPPLTTPPASVRPVSPLGRGIRMN